MEFITEAWQALLSLHQSEGIRTLLAQGGLFLAIAIIFAETGLLVGFFLPGDSLLITMGLLANPNQPYHLEGFEIWTMNILLVIAAIVGDQTGYFLGSRAGGWVWSKPDNRFFKKRYLVEAQEFYQKYGAFSLVGARYVPILRTFVPFVAGIAKMPYGKFVYWNILGGILWITSLLWVGYYLGGTPLANRLDKIIVVVIFVSLLPLIFSVGKRLLKREPEKKSTMVLKK